MKAPAELETIENRLQTLFTPDILIPEPFSIALHEQTRSTLMYQYLQILSTAATLSVWFPLHTRVNKYNIQIWSSKAAIVRIATHKIP